MCDHQSEEGETYPETSLSSQLGISQASCPMDNNRNIPSANEALKVRVGYVLHYGTERFLFTLNPSKQGCACRIHKSQKLPKVPFSTEHSTLGWHQFTQQNFRAEPLNRFPPRQCGMSQESGRAKSPRSQNSRNGAGMRNPCTQARRSPASLGPDLPV